MSDDATATTEATEVKLEAGEFVIPPRSVAAKTPAPAGSEDRVVAELARERKVRQALEAKIKEYQGLDDASAYKSEVDRLAGELGELKSSLESERVARLRAETAVREGLPVELLTASDEESLRAQAEQIKAWAVTAAARTTPRPDPTQGAKPAAADGQLTKADLASMSPEQINQALEAGRLRDVLAGKA
jgi:hypothetical protein